MGQGSVQMGELLGRRRCRHRHLELQVNIQARKLVLKVFLRFGGCGQKYLRMEVYTEFLRGHLEHSGLASGAIFSKITKFQEMFTFLK